MFIFLYFAKDIPDSFEVFHAIDRVGLEIAAFGPFVPAVDVEDTQTIKRI
jgi:hypothetical protein